MIVFPMAGLSRRFADAGYTVPKFKLPIWGGYVFDFAVSSFEAHFQTERFVFIYRETGGIEGFLKERVALLGINDAVFVGLERCTAGQAETVELGLKFAGVTADSEITIFNIDTFRRPGMVGVPNRDNLSGCLEVFEGEGDNWSFALPDPSDESLVARTAEKVAISKFCSDGLYHFSSMKIFEEALRQERMKPSAAELYIAPIFNHVINDGKLIGLVVAEIEDLRFCGVPDEYESLCAQTAPWQLAHQIDE